ncbi:AMP-binding protein, partial [Pelomonas sp. CA6]|uniref:AMP-binding protein n=1 Tax=Pelomonas sp. CA6 TaxID=2907999 RepID=UPI001F4BF760
QPQRVCALMQQALQGLLQALETDPETTLAALPLLSEDEQAQLRRWREDAQQPLQGPGEVLRRVQAQAAATPQAIALEQGDQRISYAQLQRQSLALGGWLAARGAGEEDRVAVCIPRSIAWTQALLGTWQAGAAYVPLDPQWPDARLAQTLRDCAPKAVLTLGAAQHERMVGLLDGAAVPVLDLGEP